MVYRARSTQKPFPIRVQSKQIEKGVHMALVNWLTIKKNQRNDFSFHHSPNEIFNPLGMIPKGAPFYGRVKGALAGWINHLGQMGRQSGEPDLRIDHVINGQPRSFFIELKAQGEKPNPAQEIRVAELRALGFTVFVIASNDWQDASLQITVYLGW